MFCFVAFELLFDDVLNMLNASASAPRLGFWLSGLGEQRKSQEQPSVVITKDIFFHLLLVVCFGCSEIGTQNLEIASPNSETQGFQNILSLGLQIPSKKVFNP